MALLLSELESRHRKKSLMVKLHSLLVKNITSVSNGRIERRLKLGSVYEHYIGRLFACMVKMCLGLVCEVQIRIDRQ